MSDQVIISQAEFIFNPNACTGCAACAIACRIENQLNLVQQASLSSAPAWRSIYSFNPAHQPGYPSFHLSLACNHCQEPACQAACPAAAYTKDPVTGAVTIDPRKCIGCRYCTWACPFDAPKFNPALGVIEKCTFCNHRLQAGLEPACVKACPTAALGLAHTALPAAPALTRSESGFPRTTLKPSIRFVSLQLPPAPLPPGASPAPLGSVSVAPAKISFGHEWPLWFLTAAVMVLFAWFAGPSPAYHSRLPLADAAFLASGALAMLLSTLHLGKPLRAWRAVLNLRSSWLSREIAAVSLFLGLAGLVFSAAHTGFYAILYGPAAQILLLASGIAALICIDRVYDVTLLKGQPREEVYRPRARWHSASALLGGLYLAGLAATFGPFTRFEPLQLVLAGLGFAASLLQCVLYITRHHPSEPRTPLEALLRAVRVILGFAIPWLLIARGEPGLAAFVCAAAGQALDRVEFYAELEILTPGWF